MPFEVREGGRHRTMLLLVILGLLGLVVESIGVLLPS